MGLSGKLYKKKPGDIVDWVDNNKIGFFEFTFDGGETVFNLYQDYPWRLTPEQKRIFDQENPFWAEYFKSREGIA